MRVGQDLPPAALYSFRKGGNICNICVLMGKRVKRPKKERTKLAPLSANSFSLIFFAFVHFSCRHRNTVTYVNVRREKNGRKEGRPAAASESNRIRKFRALDRLSGGGIYIYTERACTHRQDGGPKGMIKRPPPFHRRSAAVSIQRSCAVDRS